MAACLNHFSQDSSKKTMAFVFEELDCQETPLGLISLRKRAEPRLDNRILYEVKLGDEFLMSSLFPEAEIQLSRLGLEALRNNGHVEALDIVVGGLGLGYTANAALEDEKVRSLLVIDIMPAVIEWHQKHLVPLGEVLSTDTRCTLQLGDFFELATNSEMGFPPLNQQVHGIFLDIDHSPSNWLDQENSNFYTEKSLEKMKKKIVVGGIFGLWSNDLPDNDFTALLESVFNKVETHVVAFDNPYSGNNSTNSVYLAHVL